MSSDDLLGWELTYHSVKKSIEKKEDVLVVFLHWALIRSGLQCLGLGEENKAQENGSELLPEGWNSKRDSYCIRYTTKSGEIFVLKGSIVKEFLVLELVRVKDMNLATLTLMSNAVPITDFSKPLSELIPDHKSILYKIRTELISKLHKSDNKEVETQTTVPEIHLIPRPSTPTHEFVDHEPRGSDRDRYADPFGIGRSDLDPIGGGGGGMIYDPFNPLRDRRLPPQPGYGVPGGLPRGAVPPGARFDPFGPSGFGPPARGRRPPPDADHFPPPGYDDMFM